MASLRGARTEAGKHQADSLSRDHQERYSWSDRESAWHRPASCRCPAGPTGARPSGGLRAVACALEEDQAGALGRPCAVSGRSSDSWPRERDQFLQVGALLPSDSAFHHSRRCPAEGGTVKASSWWGKRAWIPRSLQEGSVYGFRHQRQASQKVAGAPLHHLDPPAGSWPQARIHCVTDHDGGPEALRSRSHHLYAYRLAQPLEACCGNHIETHHRRTRR